MSNRVVVSNASPLIALEQVAALPVLEQLFGYVHVPPAVVREVAPTIAVLPAWLVRRECANDSPLIGARATLGAGECEAIALALDCHADLVLLDDLAARRFAQSIGLSVIGTLGILLAAKRRDLVPALAPLLDRLDKAGFRVANTLRAQVLELARERITGD